MTTRDTQTEAMRTLGIDMGGTATRWVLRKGGLIVARGSVPGAYGAIENPQARAGFMAALQAIGAQAATAATAAVLGVTGCGIKPGDAIHALAAQTLGLEKILVINDMELSWRTAFGAGPGHLILAGTGSVGMSMDAGGAITLIGGRGVLVDDAGGGAWIALRAVDALCRDWDTGGERPGPLADALAAIVGEPGWDALRRWIYGGARGDAARLAPAVGVAAAAGCALSRAVLAQAGQELARLAQALRDRCGPAPLAVTGGAWQISPLILGSFQRALPGTPVSQPLLDAADHASMLAQEWFGPHDA